MIAQPPTVSPDARPARPASPPIDAARRMEELGRIILAYSDVTEKLQQSHEQLRKTVESLRHQLSEKNRQLERKNRLTALGEMAAGLAHEIRNPLGGIQLYASMLAHDVADRPAAMRNVQKISGGVKHLDALVGQVLQFTREVAITPQSFDLAALVGQSMEYAQIRFEERSVTGRIDGPSSLAVVGDPMLLGQVLLNLMINAAEAMEQGGIVSVSFGPLALESRQFWLTVCDKGPGIPPQILDRIFNPFFTTKDNGTGLGLSIVHRTIEAHDGTITATNMEGGGAKFEIRI